VTTWDAIVVGAGPAGSATARRLARAGASVLVLERARFPRDKPCSEYLSPETVRLVEALGDDVIRAVDRAAPARLYGMRIVAPDGTSVVGRFAGAHRYPSPRPCGLALPRRIFDSLLADGAARAGAEVREEVAVEGLARDGGAVWGVVCRSASGVREALRSRVVIGADGLRSVVARRLGARRSSPPRRVAFTAHLSDVAGVSEMGEMHVSESGYVGLGPVGRGVTTVALVVPAATVRARDLPARFFEEVDRFPGLRGRFRADRVVRPILATGPFAQWSPSSTADGALLVGDAADFFDPFTGQGIFAALKGAELAAETLLPLLAAGAAVTRKALAPYRAARRRAFLGKWALERAIGLGVGWPALANRVVGRLARHPALADLLVGATGNFVPAREVLAPGALARLLF